MTGVISRREFLVAGGCAVAESKLAAGQERNRRVYAYVSSWTSGGNGAGGGGGIHVFSVDERDGSLKLLSSVAPELNAGYVCVSPDGRFLYATDERKDFGGRAGAGGGVIAFAIDQRDGSLTELNSQPSMGAFPAYVAIDKAGSRVVVANHASYDTIAQLVREQNGSRRLENTYDDASVAMFPVSADGHLDSACEVAVLERGHAVGWNKDSGLDAAFRASAHAHSVNFDPSGEFVLACDKGTDRIYVYRVDQKGCAFRQVNILSTPPRTAPRHSAFHPTLPYVFVINELEPSLSSFSFDAKSGELQAIQTVPTVAKNAVNAGGKRSMPADIHVHPNGRFVYGSTRGNNTIAIFQIDEASGRMTAVDEISTLGATPRGFNFDPSGKFLFVGNQDSNTVVTFAVDGETGRMTLTGARVDVPRPVCIRFAFL